MGKALCLPGGDGGVCGSRLVDAFVSSSSLLHYAGLADHACEDESSEDAALKLARDIAQVFTTGGR